MSQGKSRKLAIVAMILLLVGLNVWRWWPDSAEKPAASRIDARDGGSLRGYRLSEFEVHALPVDVPPPLQRDLFHPKLAPRLVKKVIIKKTPVKPKAKSPEQQAREAAQAEFAQIRCVGVAFRGNTAQAYLQKGTESYLVSQGDQVADRFVVEKISDQAVTLQDPATGVGGTITVSGK